MAVATVAEPTAPGKPKLSEPIVQGARRENEIRAEHPNLYKSFLLTRLLVGIVGVLLPTVIWIWDLSSDLLAGRPLRLLGSLSAYYYHPMPLGDWFVGSLWAIGVGLMVYMGIRKSSWGNRISWAAGLAAVAVALLPTNDAGTPSTVISNLHFWAAAVLILGLGALCIGFGIDEKVRDDPGSEKKKQRRWIHYLAAGLILASVVFVLLNKAFSIWPSHGVLAAEMAAVYAFAFSWFAKGRELLEYGRTHPTDETGAPQTGRAVPPMWPRQGWLAPNR
jgi:hypothetical protein